MITSALSNKYGILAATIAGFGGLFADAFAGKYGFVVTFIIAILFLIYGITYERNIRKIYRNEQIPIPVVISIDDNTPTHLLFRSLLERIAKEDKRFKGLDKKLQRYFNISEEMLTFRYYGDMYDEARVISFLQIVRYVLNDVQKRLDNKAQFHLVYLRRPAFGIAIGGMFRTDGIMIYQNNDYSNRLDCVAIINSRKYKEKKTNFTHFTIETYINDPDSRKLLVVIQVSSHNVSPSLSETDRYKNIVILNSNKNGTLPTDRKSLMNDLWVEHAQEIYNIVNKYKKDYEEIGLLHSMPEALSIILGMSLENYWNINIYQFDTGAYKKAINLQNIKYYF